jgi:RNA polymerase sigma-70 factor (ECF subfamily)
MDEPFDEGAVIRRLQQLRADVRTRSPSLDESANRLFERHRLPLTSYCRSFVGSWSRAEEIVNEVFTTAWRRIDTYAFEGSFRGWLFGIARFTCLRAIEKKQDVLVEDGVLESEDQAAETWRVLHQRQRAQLLNEAVADLPELERRALHMRYYERLPIKRITEELNLETRSGAKGVLSRTKRHLASRLRRLMDEQGLHTSYWLT